MASAKKTLSNYQGKPIASKVITFLTLLLTCDNFMFNYKIIFRLQDVRKSEYAFYIYGKV